MNTTRKRAIFALTVVTTAVAVAALVYVFRPRELPVTAARLITDPTTKLITRGEYLARVGDCLGCHTDIKGPEFAGGRAMATPFGKFHVPNITPDDETGIGLWTADDFYRMLDEGVSKDGTLLYPAMPFANYTNVTREDSDAIYAYLMSVPPVRRENRSHELRPPFDQRELLIGWRTSHFRNGEYVPDPGQSEQWNRGAYLVKGLGHCSTCHTAVNTLAGSEESRAFAVGMIPNQNWYAPLLTSNREAGLGNWELQDIADLLQVGTSQRGSVFGPMAEVVYNSLQYLTDEDAMAMAVYLKSLPQRDSNPLPGNQARHVDSRVMGLGRKIYAQQCSVCHGSEGAGFAPAMPPLAGNQSISILSPVNAIRMVLNGGYAPGTMKNPRPYGMPPFSHVLNDEEIAAVVTYIRVAWNNRGSPVAPVQVNELRPLVPVEAPNGPKNHRGAVTNTHASMRSSHAG